MTIDERIEFAIKARLPLGRHKGLRKQFLTKIQKDIPKLPLGKQTEYLAAVKRVAKKYGTDFAGD